MLGGAALGEAPHEEVVEVDQDLVGEEQVAEVAGEDGEGGDARCDNMAAMP